MDAPWRGFPFRGVSELPRMNTTAQRTLFERVIDFSQLRAARRMEPCALPEEPRADSGCCEAA